MINGKVVVAEEDYDTYLLHLPWSVIRKNKREEYILGELEKVHPCFSPRFDFKSEFVLGKNGKNCKVLVMDKLKISDYKSRWGIETFNNYIKNNAGFKGLKFQDYYEQRGFDFIMLVTGLIYSSLNDGVKKIGKPSISTFDILIKAGHMRMVLENDTWKLHNTRIKYIELFGMMGFVPEKTLSL